MASRKQKIIGWFIAAFVVVLIAVLIVFLQPLRQQAAGGANVLAKQMCSCLYIEARAFDDCRADMFVTLDAIDATEIKAEKAVSTGVGVLGVSSKARYHQDLGCWLE